jgi:hypothetical protein
MPRGAAVELRGPAGAGAAATRWAAVLDLQQPVGLQPIEVELRDVVRDADAGGGPLAAHRLRLRDHEPVQRAADRLAERSDAAQLVIGGHDALPPSVLTNTVVDETAFSNLTSILISVRTRLGATR